MCVLCDLIKAENPIYQDAFCFFVIGHSRKVPMGVTKIHGMPIDELNKSRLTRKAQDLYGKNAKIVAPMRSVKNHYHIHVYVDN